MPDKKIHGEPWVDLPDAERLRDWSREDEIAYNQTSRQEEKYRFYRLIFDFLSDNQVSGDYFEFGCHRARTFRMALTEARRHGLDGMRFYAFDSFEGLPDVAAAGGHRVWSPGALSTSEDSFRAMIGAHGIYPDRVETIKGFYADSLDATARDRLLARGAKISLLTVDCDFYDSAVPVLDFAEHFLQQGSVVYVDDYFAGYKGNPRHGVAAAFAKYRERSRWAFTDHMTIGWWGRSFIAYPRV